MTTLPGFERIGQAPAEPMRRLPGRRGMRRVHNPQASDRGAPRSHKCPAPECTIFVPQQRLACSSHWFSLPQELRDRINRTYRKNRRAHLEAYREAVHLLGAPTAHGGLT